jgi:Zn-dependent peptidase ImmA (M78 family)
MRITGLEKLNRQDIEKKAARLLTHFRSDYFDRVRAIPLLTICDFLTDRHNIKFHFNVKLGFNQSGKRVLGLCNPIAQMILIDGSISDGTQPTKFNFTLAHEMGHLALHRKINIERTEEIELQDELRDTDTEVKEEEGVMKSDNDWMEWQANSYAVSLLMPEPFVKVKLIQVKEAKGISNRIPGLYINEQPSSIRDYQSVVMDLSEFFGVSRTSIEYRLRGLDLVQKGITGVKTVDEILRGMNF